MSFIKTDFPDLLIFEPKVFADSRGYFFESYNENTCKAEGVDIKFVQDNQASSQYGVIRGLHFSKRQLCTNKIGSLFNRINIRCGC